MSTQEIFRRHIARWGFTEDGEPIQSPSSVLYHVRFEGNPAVLKIFKPKSDEKNSPKILTQYGGNGAVNVLRASEEALLMERAMPGNALSDLVVAGRDSDATYVFCDIAKKLHTAKNIGKYAQPLAALSGGFDRYLASGDATLHPDKVKRAKTIFKQLCGTQKNFMLLLHGDLQHENIIYDDFRGWLAVDPKGYLGEAEFEAAAFLRNPLSPEHYASENTIRHRIGIIAEMMKLNPTRILAWTFSSYILSVIWHIEDKTLKNDWQVMLDVLEKMIGTKALIL